MKALVEATPISGPGMGGEEQVRLARHRAGRNVDDDGDPLALGAGVAKRGEGVGGLARLRDEEGEPARLEHRLAVAELGGDIELDRDPGELLEPIFGDHPGVEAGSAGDDGDPRHAGEILVHGRQRDLALERAEVGGEGLGDHDRLLEYLLLHEMGVIALVGGRVRGAGGDDLALDRLVGAVEDARRRHG